MSTMDDINYDLPEALIAVKPTSVRHESRLLRVNIKDKTITDSVFSTIIESLQANDCLVFNNTKVFKARLYGRSELKAKIELLLIEKKDESTWTAMVKNSKKIPVGTKVQFGPLNTPVNAVILDKIEDMRFIQFERPVSFEEINTFGEVPLPPYILKKRRKMELSDTTDADDFRYQSVLASHYGSVAAPTASLHFSEELISQIKQKGISITTLTLHVGPGTFKPIDTETLDDFVIHHEWIDVPQETVKTLQSVKANGGRIIAVGTTAVRALETMALTKNSPSEWQAFSGNTSLFIQEGHSFKAVDAMVTNFHMPKSTLLLLVYAFGGKELVQKAYLHAVQDGYRFLSYGDAMFLS